MKNLSFNQIALLALAMLANVTSAHAALAADSNYSDIQATYNTDITGTLSSPTYGSGTDLIYSTAVDASIAGAAPYLQTPSSGTLSSASYTGNINQVQYINDLTSGDGTSGGSYVFGDGSSTDTFLLNTDSATGGSETGYSIADFRSIAGYGSASAFSDQDYTISYETLASIAADPTNPWISLGRFANYGYYTPYTPGGSDYMRLAESSEINVYDTTGTIATGVVGFQVNTINTQSVVHEWMLFGSPTVSEVPEPATWALILGGMGVLGLYLRRRNA